MLFCMGQILPEDPCVWQNMVNNFGGIFTLQNTDMADMQGITITDDLCNYYRLSEFP